MKADVLLAKAKAGDEYATAKCARRIDDRDEAMLSLLPLIFEGARGAQLIGLTGNPGAGKSTLTNQLVRSFRALGEKVAVIAVDPSSPFSGGAILGDRVRMQEHAGDEGVFIRSVATRGVLGGISHSTRDLIALFDFLGFDRIIVETVGVGQDEIDIAFTVETNIVVCLPGTGDGVQMIKAGLLETADIFVLNKADHADAGRAINQLQKLVSWSKASDGSHWDVPVCATIANVGEGIDALVSTIEQHRKSLKSAADVNRKAVLRRKRWAEEMILSRLQSRANQAIEDLNLSGTENPYVVAQRVVDDLFRK